MHDNQRLDAQVCFALYAAARTATAAYRDALADLGLTYTQYVTLLALWERDGRSVSELGSLLHLDSGTLSPLLKRLAAAGLVERRRDSADERRVTIHLTDAGQAMRGEVGAIQRRLREHVTMSDDELVTLRELAHRFTAAVDADGPTTTP